MARPAGLLVAHRPSVPRRKSHASPSVPRRKSHASRLSQAPEGQFPVWLTGRPCTGTTKRAIQVSTESVPRVAHWPSLPQACAVCRPSLTGLLCRR
jgi:hypothetical protein